MKKRSTSKSAPARRSFNEGGFFNLRVLTASVLCLFGVFVALMACGAFSNLFAKTKGPKQAGAAVRQDAPGTQKPEVTQLIGPAVIKGDLRSLPEIPSGPKISRPLLTRYPHGTEARTESEET